MKNVVVCPDYRVSNPYLEQMYSALGNEYNVSYVSYDEVDEALKKSDVFHLHWTSGILSRAQSIYEAKFAVRVFISKVKRYIVRGGKFFWTVHNRLSHDSRYIEVERSLNEELSKLAHQVFVHNELAKDILPADYFINRRKISVSEHGSYIGVYPNSSSRSEARKELGIQDGETVFLFLGQIRPYKGITDLVVAFSKIKKTAPNAKLIIAGKPVHPIKPGEISQLYGSINGIQIHEGVVEDELLQVYFGAADFAVFPYKNILTSGSVLNSFSFSCPVIAPNDGVLPEVITDGVNGFTYNKGCIESLFSVMDKALALNDSCKEAMRTHAMKYAENIHWSNGADAISSSYKLSSIKHDYLGGGAKLINDPRTCGAPVLSVVVLNYNCEQDVLKVISSIRKQSLSFDYQIIVVDNKSTNINENLLCHYFSDCHIIRLNTNTGYARGNNVGVKYAIEVLKSEYVMISNPDIEYLPNSMESLLDGIKYIGADIVSPAILRDDTNKVWSAGGEVSVSEGVNVDHHYSGEYSSELPSEPYEVDYAAGACLLFNNSLIKDVGYIPEDYFLYYEETDWCMEARRKGKRIVVIPSIFVRHHKNSEPKGKPPKEYYLYYYVRNTFKFYRKFGPGNFEMLEQNLLERFVNPWKERIKDSFPAFSQRLNTLMDRAVMDGKEGVSGKTLNSDDDITTGNLKLRLDAVTSDGNVHGWAINTTDAKSKVKLGIFVDELHVGDVTCDEYREDLLKAGVSDDGCHGYSFKIPRTYINGKQATVSVRWREVDAINSPATVKFESAGASYKGRIDGISGGFLRGWLIDESDFIAKLKFKLFSDGKFLGIYSADNYREDLEAAFKSDGYHAILVKLPMYVLDGRAHIVKVEAINDSGETLYSCEREVAYSLQEPKLPEAFNMFRDINKWLYVHRSVYVQDEKYPSVKKYFECMKQGLAFEAAEYFEGLNDLPLISIVMPVFNRENVVLEAIKSVVDQVYQNWELIIVDDGSSDRTVEVIQSSNDDGRVSIVQLEVNMGVSSARNAALKKAKGELIAYLDSDNTWDKDYLSIMVCQLHKNQSKGCAYAGQVIHQTCELTNGEKLIEEAFLRAGPFNQALIRNRNFIDLNAFMHRRSLYQTFGGFNEKMKRLVDWELIVRYTYDERPVYVPALLSNYYMDLVDNQITKVESFLDSLNEYRHSLAATGTGSSRPESIFGNALFFIPECTDEERLDSTLASIVTSANVCGYDGKVSVILMSSSQDIQSKYSRSISFIPGNSEIANRISRNGGIACLIKEGRQVSPNFFADVFKSLSDDDDRCYVIPKLSKYDKNIRLEQPYATDVGFVDNTVSSSNWSILKYDSLLSLNGCCVELSQIDASKTAGLIVSTKVLERITARDDFEEIVTEINAFSYMGMVTINIHEQCKLIEN